MISFPRVYNLVAKRVNGKYYARGKKKKLGDQVHREGKEEAGRSGP